MRLLHFVDPRRIGRPIYHLGVRTEAGVLFVERAVATALHRPDVATSLADLLLVGPAGLAKLETFVAEALAEPQTGWFLPEDGVQFAPAVLQPEKIICVGLNYRAHADEAGFPLPETPILFSKFNNSLAAHGWPIPLPPVARQYDYEGELAVVIKRPARDVSVDDALDYVFGYTIANDLSARDLQMRTSQWLLGKSLDRFLPIGPYLVTADEIPMPQTLHLRTWVNGALRQDAAASDMIFSVAELISYASRHMTLAPGDVLVTGTPAGVILGMADPVWLQSGDEIVVEIDGIGRLANTLMAV